MAVSIRRAFAPRCGVLAAVAALLGCQPATPALEPWQEAEGYRWQSLGGVGAEAAGFTSLAANRTGVEFRNDVADAKAFANRHLVQGSGVAIGDVDGDDRPDVYLARIDGPNALYRNLGGMRFDDIAAEAGATLADHPSTGAVLADVDGDGDRDLLVTAMGGRNRLLLNDGTGRFTDATEASGFVAEARGSTTATLADADGDGDLDLYVANYKAKTMLDSLSPQERAFDQLVRRTGSGFEVVAPLRDNYRVVMREDIRGVSVVQRADPDWFYRNEGGGRFVREPLAGNPRFVDERGAPLDREPDDFGLAARFVDVSGDGAPDLYVANDFEDPDQFWINDGQGRFRLVDAVAVRQTSNSGMAVDAADFDRDGDVDLFEVDMLANDSHRRKTQIPTHTPLPKVVGDYGRRAQWQRNVLLANRGDGTFAEVGRQAGVEASGWSWSALFLDVDLDGYEDLLIGTGHRWDLMDADIQERLKSTVTGVDWREERKLYPRLALRNVAFRNRGDATFEDATDSWRFGVEEDISHGIATGDLDGDGDQDVVVNRLDAPALVLRNDAHAPRVLVELEGRAPNRDGIGARVSVDAEGLPSQTREITAGGLYLSGSDRSATFAAPGSAVTIVVRWRSGVVSRLVGVPINRRYRIEEPVGPPERTVPPAVAPSLFEDVSALLGHGHVDRGFDDTQRQPLLINQLSQLGPGVAWTDLDQDGDDDLVVGSGAGGRLGVFRNDRGRFAAVPGTLVADSFDLTAVVGDDRGGLFVAQSSYEASTPLSAVTAPAVYLIERGRALAVVAPGDTTSAGPIALADLDGDGDLDLFVGGRVAPGVYPAPGTSRIFRRDGAGFRLDGENAAVLRTIGMVSGAVFSDVDGDGDPDLVLAMDWGPIRILRNDAGRLSDQTRAWGLDSLTGRWNSVSAGDFDGDGRMDLVAGNWGRNTGVVADRDHPLHLYFGSWAEDGSVRMSPAGFDPRLGGISLGVTLGRLAAAVPSQRTRTPTYAAYADATVERTLGALMSRTGRLTATTLDHVVLLNRGARFEVRSLPWEAQVAPGFGVVVADFDGNGTEDLFLAQNFSPTNIAAPTFDAGLGLVLLGDGRGGLVPLGGVAAGIRLPADQRGAAAADFDGDGRIDLAVGQNAAATRLFRNRSGAPGLRIRFAGGRVAGAVVRLKYDDGLGPVRESHLGGGYWSQDGGVMVLGRRAPVRAVVVRWPGGGTEEVPVTPDQTEVVLRPPGR